MIYMNYSLNLRYPNVCFWIKSQLNKNVADEEAMCHLHHLILIGSYLGANYTRTLCGASAKKPALLRSTWTNEMVGL